MTDAEETGNKRAEECLRLLESMAAELGRGMQAIARNELAGFEESVSTQAELAARLSESASCVSAGPQVPSFASELDPNLRAQIRDAYLRLQQLNRTYAALINESTRSVQRMISLCHSFGGQMREDFGRSSKQQTWSCRM
ncbi:hypothetical protein DYQ86_00235 [Acidobacteria bacterium AB60]|nr:hypothetical protein DYQ86_00235 [Acidobacteria bacterium AB60]